jgi:XTP/dITP diphosphohydrolase
MAGNEILLATRNMHKVEEIGEILEGSGLLLKTLLDFPGLGDALEDGESYEENARKKAFFYAAETGRSTLADDSGLEIDALPGMLGIHSARFMGPEISFRERCEHILKLMETIEEPQRKAHFTCVVSIVDPHGKDRLFRGELHGFIAREIKGGYGFGYDPIFLVPEFGKNLAELEPAVKNSVSHRSRALARAREALHEIFPSLSRHS